MAVTDQLELWIGIYNIGMQDIQPQISLLGSSFHSNKYLQPATYKFCKPLNVPQLEWNETPAIIWISNLNWMIKLIFLYRTISHVTKYNAYENLNFFSNSSITLDRWGSFLTLSLILLTFNQKGFVIPFSSLSSSFLNKAFATLLLLPC